MINCLTYIGSPAPKQITKGLRRHYGTRGLSLFQDCTAISKTFADEMHRLN